MRGNSKRKYKFTDKSQSIGGIISTIIAVLSIGFFIAGIYSSYQDRGNGGRIVGLFGLTSFLLASLGLYAGVSSFKEEEIFFLFSWIGTLANAIMIVGMAMIMIIGI